MIQVVDIFHTKQKVWDIGRAIYGQDSELTGRWADDQIAEPKRSEVYVLLETLSKHRNRHQEVVQVLMRSLSYVTVL